MKCPSCGYVSLDRQESCKRCGAPMMALGGGPTGPAPAEAPAAPFDESLLGLRLENDEPAPQRRRRTPGRRRRGRAAEREPSAVEMLDDDTLEIGEEELAPLAPADQSGGEPDDGPMPFHLDDEIFGDTALAATSTPGEPTGPGGWESPAEREPGPASQIPEPLFVLSEDAAAASGAGAPVIDRDEEVPERFWAPEIAGLRRRAAAQLVDQTLLALLLGGFFATALVALRLAGLDGDPLLRPNGLQAAALPFALLGALLSLCYYGFFHGYAGCTPGKSLAGVEIRTSEGAAPSWGRVVLRWWCAALGLAAAGAGLAWALFEPRRRGWADLLSGTVLARRRAPQGPAPALTARGGGGYHACAVQGRDSSAGRATD